MRAIVREPRNSCCLHPSAGLGFNCINRHTWSLSSAKSAEVTKAFELRIWRRNEHFALLMHAENRMNGFPLERKAVLQIRLELLKFLVYCVQDFENHLVLQDGRWLGEINKLVEVQSLCCF